MGVLAVSTIKIISTKSEDAKQVPKQVDWTDIKFTLFLGVIIVVVKLLELYVPVLQVRRVTTDEVASMLIVGYILLRVGREPEKLKSWGLTTGITVSGFLMAIALFIVALGMLVVGGIAAAGTLSFEPAYITQMVEYIPAAFPQQFVMCSVGLATLSTLRPLRGLWRLPLVVGLLFSLAHFWTPARIPGTIIPIQMILTFPAGFFAAFYFLKFRSILPLTAIHAIMYPLLYHWIEAHL